ncbi:MAG: DUF2061 domain-containing protein [Candidatus Aminicenantes bacterium]|nr:DUF2061 domain-containing protein [Candidatus Aminicenantes bacterium]
MAESHKRSIAKAVSYRFMATLTTATVVFILTRKLSLAVGVGILDMFAKMGFFYLHERFWAKVKWGRTRHPLESLQVTKDLSPEDLEKVKTQLKSMGYIE